MIVVLGGVQAQVRIDMTMPKAPNENDIAPEVSPWEREAYGEGGRFGSMTGIPSGDPSKDKISVTFAGCGFTVAKKLAAAGEDVRFIGLVGDDPLGMAALADLEKAGVDTSQVIRGREQTSVRITARNFLGDVEFARVDERIVDEFDVGKIAEKSGLIGEADLVFADGNIPEETLKAAGDMCRDKDVPLYFDPSSMEGATRGAAALGSFTGIMPGRMEAEAMAGLEILSPEQMDEAATYFEEKGVRRIMITIKGGGIFYKEGENSGIIRPERVIKYAETSGAGDLVSAAAVLAFARGENIEEAAKSGMDAAADFLADVVDERKY